MEGLIDWVLRDVLTAVGGIDQCSTEFIRVTDRLLPEEMFFKFCPELKTQSRTRAGVPILIQLLGGQPEPLAENAARAAELGAYGIDFNFGCPAKLVNRHDGGASLLKSPDRIFNILSKARAYVPAHIPISAKMRLGIDHPNDCAQVAQAVEAAGVRTLTVHCRTKAQMYKPPAHWEWITKIKETVKVNIIANGDIWNIEDFYRCKLETGCSEFMIGRGAIANPQIFNQIQSSRLNDLRVTTSLGENSNLFQAEQADNFQLDLKTMIPQFYDSCIDFRNESYAVARTKQWLSQLSKRSEPTQVVFNHVKTITSPATFKSELLRSFSTST